MYVRCDDFDPLDPPAALEQALTVAATTTVAAIAAKYRTFLDI
jgi:hypothetical protein